MPIEELRAAEVCWRLHGNWTSSPGRISPRVTIAPYHDIRTYKFAIASSANCHLCSEEGEVDEEREVAEFGNWMIEDRSLGSRGAWLADWAATAARLHPTALGQLDQHPHVAPPC